MRPKVVASFDSYTDDGLLKFSKQIRDSLKVHPAFQGDWHSAISLEKLSKAIDEFETAKEAAQYRDLQKIGIREGFREKLIIALNQTAHFVQMVGFGDYTILSGTGFEIREGKRSAPRTYAPLASPDYSVMQGDVLGMVIGTVKMAPGVSYYEVHITQGDPTVEENWVFAANFTRKNGSRMEHRGLNSAQKYSLRVRGVGDDGPGPWSDPKTILVH
ncbi:fibronectin type III domain-containing protein [Geomesophilobacter sediminis]|uniref:Fibronectin type III domain-containing protein n=1 Tax=Geomesophilobacter sediminis TaxID=2798584 RepID=A0A8J7IMV4_9BACT|nr:fibronectin type III domain-containing protein [Geomesophilobacter sediminis]MBJ6724263.1 fibronectin type III domain-containing protein [Geomesophilobacter sediminis]